MDFDDLGLVKFETIEDEWREKFSVHGPDVVTLASRYRNDQPCVPVNIYGGSFNFCVQVRFDDGLEWVLRFPIPGRVMHPEEKTRQEAATMRFIKERTNIPIPYLAAFGMAKDNPLGLGPFIITEFVEGKPLSEVLRADPRDSSDKILNPNIDDLTLEVVYKQISNILLELSDHDFNKIGSLSMSEGKDSWAIESKPLTLKMNEMERCGNLNLDDHPGPFEGALDYIESLAQQNLKQLYNQRNCVDDAEDARQKYNCRHLIHSVVPHFVPHKYNQGPFKLFCDDFRPGNILVDENLQITAVLDWEWCYTAPQQFLYSPPRWLLLKPPVDWDNRDHGEQDLLRTYMSKFNLFIRILEEQEESRLKRKGRSKLDDGCYQRMSSHMRQSMADGTFWFNEAIRQSFSLDEIWWKRLDALCFGSGDEGSNVRSQVLSKVTDKEDFVKLKMEQLNQYNDEYSAMIEEGK